MNIRGMQSGFIEAMANAKVIEPTIEAIIGFLNDTGVSSSFFEDITEKDILIMKSVYDSRNGWNTHMVLLNGFPVAYTDSNIKRITK